jgi:uncharacterized membrane protein
MDDADTATVRAGGSRKNWGFESFWREPVERQDQSVFIPNSPNTFSGSVFFVASDTLRPLDAPLRSALSYLEQLGAKGGSFLSNLSLVDCKPQ